MSEQRVDLEAVRCRYANALWEWGTVNQRSALADIPALIAEVERLRGLLGASPTRSEHGDG
jgi:hypothetical protein